MDGRERRGKIQSSGISAHFEEAEAYLNKTKQLS